MVGFIPHRRFASERSLHQEQRLLRFAVDPESGANVPDLPERVPAVNVPEMTAAERDKFARAMATPDAGGRGGGADHGGEGGGGGGGGGHEGGGEHGEGGALTPHGIVTAIDHKMHEIHDLREKFKDKKLRKHLDSSEDKALWAEYGGFVESIDNMLRDMKTELEPLDKWAAGEMDPESFLTWMIHTQPEGPLTKAEKVEMENVFFRGRQNEIESEMAQLQTQMGSGTLSPKESDRAGHRMAELRRETAALQQRHDNNLRRIENPPDDTLLVEGPTDPKAVTRADDRDFASARSDAVVELRSLMKQWPTANQSDRLVLVQEAMAIPAIGLFIQQKLRRAQNALKRIDEEMERKKVAEVVGEVKRRAGGDEVKKDLSYAPHTNKDLSGFAPISAFKAAIGTVGLKFYSVKGVMEGFHLWWEAWKGALHKYHHREGSMFANFLGKATQNVPFGEEVFTELEQNDDKANDEVKDTFKEILTKRDVDFKALVDGPNSELARNINDYNRTRAILEYAASRGWLYDLDQGSQEHFFGKHIHDLVPHEWDHNRVKNYVSKLTTEQNQGKKAEQEKYHQRYFNVNSTDVFVKLMEEELTKVNMWGAMGILQRSLERGLWGEVSPWHAVALIRQMQSNKLLQRYITVDFIDQFGNKSLYNSFGRWSGNVTKLTRKQWYRAIQESVRSGRTLDIKNVVDIDSGKTMQSVDVFIRAENALEGIYGKKYGELSAADKKEFDQKLAQFLSGSIVEKNGKRTSIFTSKFSDWTDKDVGQGQIKIADEDEDYYRNGTFHNPSETTTLADSTVMEQIFSVTGNGQFDNETRARFAADSIVTMIEDFEEKGMTTERAQFIRITRRKMTQWFQRYVADARASAVAFQKMLRPHHNADRRTEYIVLEFVRNEIIDLNTIASGLHLQGKLLSENILAQCNVYAHKLPPKLQGQLRTIMAGLTPEQRQSIKKVEESVRSGNVEAPPSKGHSEGAH